MKLYAVYVTECKRVRAGVKSHYDTYSLYVDVITSTNYISEIKHDCKNEYAVSNQKNCGNGLQAILLIKFNKLELIIINHINSLKVNHLK